VCSFGYHLTKNFIIYKSFVVLGKDVGGKDVGMCQGYAYEKCKHNFDGETSCKCPFGRSRSIYGQNIDASLSEIGCEDGKVEDANSAHAWKERLNVRTLLCKTSGD
jgi:hypothetical protein